MKYIARRTLVLALVLSLAIHMVASIFIHPISHVAASAEPERMTIVTVVAVHSPPPTPKPTPETQQQVHQNTSSAPKAPTIPQKPGDAEPGPPIPRGTDGTGGDFTPGTPGPPEPTATPKPSCSDPEAPARTLTAMTPDVPDDAQQRSGRTQVKVELSDTGSVLGVTIYTSSGDMALDRVALSAARRSTYRPELHNCLPVRGAYLFNVDFQE